MEIIIDPIEARVLGSLIEKRISTPDHYPLTLNSLTTACNQKSNRDPVMDLDEKTIVRALDGLREKRIAWQVRTAGSRMPKYEHNLEKIAEFSTWEIGILCELLLRGPQTVGELRSHTARLYKFDDLSEVNATLRQLSEREDGPFVVKLPRRAGRKECRYSHLFSGEAPVDKDDGSPVPEAATLEVRAENERIAKLEEQVSALEAELNDLKRKFDEFTRQFE